MGNDKAVAWSDILCGILFCSLCFCPKGLFLCLRQFSVPWNSDAWIQMPTHHLDIYQAFQSCHVPNELLTSNPIHALFLIFSIWQHIISNLGITHDYFSYASHSPHQQISSLVSLQYLPNPSELLIIFKATTFFQIAIISAWTISDVSNWSLCSHSCTLH